MLADVLASTISKATIAKPRPIPVETSSATITESATTESAIASTDFEGLIAKIRPILVGMSIA